jgi:hypothetical protein
MNEEHSGPILAKVCEIALRGEDKGDGGCRRNFGRGEPQEIGNWVPNPEGDALGKLELVPERWGGCVAPGL